MIQRNGTRAGRRAHMHTHHVFAVELDSVLARVEFAALDPAHFAHNACQKHTNGRCARTAAGAQTKREMLTLGTNGDHRLALGVRLSRRRREHNRAAAPG